MNTIAIIGAMPSELADIRAILGKGEIKHISGFDFYINDRNGKTVINACCGIAKVNAALCAQVMIDNFHPDCIINTGIAGSLNADINIGDIVLSEDALQHDVDAVAFGYDVSVIPRMETSLFRADQRLIDIAKSACEDNIKDINVYVGRIVSGDQFISDKDKKDYLIKTFNGDCTEMEGAAIAHAAYLNNIPFLIIRAISDKADDSAHMDYPEFEKKAINNSVILLKAMIENM